MDGRINAALFKDGRIGQIDEVRALQRKLCNQRGMLHETLIVFGPGRGEFARGIDRRRANRIPAAAEAGRPLARERQVRPTWHEGAP
jgi:hypothetical protein